MYSLTLNFATSAELRAALDKLDGAAPNGQASGKAAKSAAASPSPSPAAPSPAAPAAPKVVKYEDSGIGDMLKKAASDAAKKPKAVALLNEMGAVKEGKVSGQHLKPEQYDDFKAKLQAILDATAEEEPIG